MEVVGEIHSHPYPYHHGNGVMLRDRAMSEGDFNREPAGVQGICVVVQRKNKSLVSSCRFYPPIQPIRVTHED